MRRPREVRRDVQGLRALAVLAVVLFHASDVLPGGFVGVDIFFVISGFVIALSLLREHERFGRIRLGKFYIRRFKRLVPALALVVGVTLVVSAFVLSPLGPQQTAAVTGLAAVFSAANIAIALTTGDYFDSPAELNPLLHTWSLSVEEQFYLVFPLALLLGLSLFAKKYVGAAVAIGAGTVLSFGALLAAPAIQSAYETPLVGFYSPIVRAWEFGVGALIAVWFAAKPRDIGRGSSKVLYLVGAGALALSFSPAIGLGAFPGVITVLPVAGTAALIVAGHGKPWGGRDPLSTRVAGLLGDWSYSIYLWHWPFVSFSAILWPESSIAPLAAALVSLAPAIASYYVVENRLRFTVWPSIPRASVVVATTVGAPALLAGALWFASSQIATQLGSSAADDTGDEVDIGELARERPPGYELGCHGPPSLADPLSVCSFDFPDDLEENPPVYLVGDSNAAHFTEGLRVASSDSGRDLFVATASNCPLLDGAVPRVGGDIDVQKCERWQDMLIEHLEQSAPGIVVLAGTDSYWLGNEGTVIGRDGEVLTEQDARLDSFDHSVNAIVTVLISQGHEVVLADTVPQWRGDYQWSLDSCSLVETLAGCNESMPLAHHLATTEPVRKILDNADRSSSIEVADFSAAICPDDQCQTRLDGVWVYRDGSHLSNAFSRSLSDEWLVVLAP